MYSLSTCFALVVALLALSLPAQAQDADERPEAVPLGQEAMPRLYLDCRRCDDAFIRQEVTFVDHVRDRAAADVHVLVVDERTGGGGRRYTFSFIGQRGFSDVGHTLTYTAGQNEAEAEVREGISEVLKVGLVPYMLRTEHASRLQVSFDAPEGVETTPAEDPWRHWTFEVYGGGNANTESAQSAWNARYGFFADRVTEDWKIRLRPYFNHNVRRISREDEEDLLSNQRRHGFQSYVIKSLGGHWGAGVFASYHTNTSDNFRHSVRLTPAVEYSIFPYEEASHRQITFSYRIGYEGVDYFEETIFEKTEEHLLSQELDSSIQYRQPWGSISSSITGSRYFREGNHHRLTANGNVSFNLGGGLAFNVGGRYERINDQLSLPRGDATLEDILLDQRQLATAYRASLNMGLSYTFGSIFTNVVNPRL